MKYRKPGLPEVGLLAFGEPWRAREPSSGEGEPDREKFEGLESLTERR